MKWIIRVLEIWSEKPGNKYPELIDFSLDKGFHSPKNGLVLCSLLEQVVLTKKGAARKQSEIQEQKKVTFDSQSLGTNA